MAFEYACFISYRRGEGVLMGEFPRRFVEALKSELEPYLDDLDIFLDEEEIKGGDSIDKKLAKALCRSACMIILFVPKYFSEKKPYCTREYLAMEYLKNQRQKMIQDNQIEELQPPPLIITVAFRGSEKLPAPLKAIKYYDFTGYDTGDEKAMVKNPNYTKEVREIAEIIAEHLENCKPYEGYFFQNFEQFELPSEDEAKEWLVSHGIARVKREFPRA